VIILAKRQFIDLTSVLLAGLTLVLLIRFKKLPEPVVIISAALLGLVIKTFQG
jgi:chromate transporter